MQSPVEKIEQIELPRRRKVVRFDFRQPPRSGDDVVALSGVGKRYGSRVVYDGFDFLVRRGERWCVMGRNGAGNPVTYGGTYEEYVAKSGHEAPGVHA